MLASALVRQRDRGPRSSILTERTGHSTATSAGGIQGQCFPPPYETPIKLSVQSIQRLLR